MGRRKKFNLKIISSSKADILKLKEAISLRNDISIVIITKNRRNELKKCINSLKNQKFNGKKEIVVVDSSDKKNSIQNVKYIYKKKLGIAAARNAGIKNCKYDLVAFVDDDCIVDKNCLKELANSIDGNVCVGGAVLPPKTNLMGRAVSYIGYPGGGLRWYYKARGETIEVSHISTCNSLYRKKVLKGVKYFDEKFKYGGEDSDLSKRLVKKGFSLLYTPKAVVYHKPRESILSISKWFFRRGIADMYSKTIKEKIKILFYPNYSILKILFCVLITYFFGIFGIIFLFLLTMFLFMKKLIDDGAVIKEINVLFLIPIILLIMIFARGIGNIYGIKLKD